jgi:hypothetical protein
MKPLTASPTRRDVIRLLGLASLGAAPAFSKAKLKIGHTGITWGNDSEEAIKDVAGLGFYGFETFGNVLEAWEAKGGLARILDAHKLPLISAYCSCNLVEARKAERGTGKDGALGRVDPEVRRHGFGDRSKQRQT